MSKCLALDANLLVLLIVGQVSRPFIARHRRVRGYTENDFEILARIISRFERIVLTPNTATETSILLPYGVKEPLRSRFMATLAVVLQSSEERYEPSSIASAEQLFLRLGLTDAVWLRALEGESVLLTDDHNLYRAALGAGATAYHFAAVRRYGTLN